MTSALAAEVIGTQFPELAPVRVSYLNEGCDSAAFDVNDAWVFRFPKRADVERQLLVEVRVLPVLSAHAPLAIPRFRFHGQPCPAFPRHFVGYPKLAGVPAIEIDPARVPFGALASMLAGFLTSLHAFPVAELAHFGVDTHDIGSLVEEVRAEALDDFALVSTVAPDAPLDQWHAYLTAGPGVLAAPSLPAVLLHNDLAAEHILLDPPVPIIPETTSRVRLV